MPIDLVPIAAFMAGLAIGFEISRRLYNRRYTSVDFNQIIRGPTKMVLVVRNDLKMGKGKVAAQCAHAAVSACENALKSQPEILNLWHSNGQPKIVVKVETEQELLDVHQKAKRRGLMNSLIRDAGHTQVAPGSKTVVCVGPAYAKDVDEITGQLKLY